MTNPLSSSLRAAILLCSASAVTCLAAQAQTSNPPITDPVAKPEPVIASESGKLPAQSATESQSQQGAVAETNRTIGPIGNFDPLAESSKLKSPNTDASPPPPKGPSADKWQFQFVPYIWFAGLKGQIGIGSRITDVDADIGDIFDHLNFGFMAAFEARKGKFLLLSDLLYLKVSTENVTPGPLFSSAKLTQKVFLLEGDAGYRLLEKEGSSLDAIAGIRFWHLHTRLLFTAGVLPETEDSRSKNWVDGVGGLRGRAFVTKSWFVFGKGDVGGGGSDLTYQLLGGIGATFKERFSLLAAYRYLHVNYDRNNFLFDVGIKGPALGFGIKF
ncbi:MAG TPA: hypothetical protein VKM94_22240 [Blastocatellia bacterium]|nr:hypothetical protein [Blastocatellia bacterium]